MEVILTVNYIRIALTKILQRIKILIFFHGDSTINIHGTKWIIYSDTIAKRPKLLGLKMHYLLDAVHFYLIIHRHSF